ncbi:GntR family transcriptional regulator [Ramlibacter sp. PS3R-8]|uniref:GntR family transcriptional regulator n=1 Tax=Ramlibacter sp. PS3R-8 TaxID=3133437 RepID=UPI00309D7231
MSSLAPTPSDGAGEGRLLREKVYDQLRADMIACRLAPGTEIRESELALRFGVSKSPVRDALMRLEREGLVITLPRQGYRVAPVSVADVQDMFHLRDALERACMERIARRASDEQLASLDRFRTYEAGAWEGGFVAYNREFHRTLARISGNPRMRDQLIDLVDQMDRAVQLSLSSLKRGDPKTVVDEHCQLIDALQARDTPRAQRIASRHVGDAGKRVLQALSRVVVAA